MACWWNTTSKPLFPTPPCSWRLPQVALPMSRWVKRQQQRRQQQQELRLVLLAFDLFFVKTVWCVFAVFTCFLFSGWCLGDSSFFFNSVSHAPCTCEGHAPRLYIYAHWGIFLFVVSVLIPVYLLLHTVCVSCIPSLFPSIFVVVSPSFLFFLLLFFSLVRASETSLRHSRSISLFIVCSGNSFFLVPPPLPLLFLCVVLYLFLLSRSTCTRKDRIVNSHQLSSVFSHSLTLSLSLSFFLFCCPFSLSLSLSFICTLVLLFVVSVKLVNESNTIQHSRIVFCLCTRHTYLKNTRSHTHIFTHVESCEWGFKTFDWPRDLLLVH